MEVNQEFIKSKIMAQLLSQLTESSLKSSYNVPAAVDSHCMEKKWFHGAEGICYSLTELINSKAFDKEGSLQLAQLDNLGIKLAQQAQDALVEKPFGALSDKQTLMLSALLGSVQAALTKEITLWQDKVTALSLSHSSNVSQYQQLTLSLQQLLASFMQVITAFFKERIVLSGQSLTISQSSQAAFAEEEGAQGSQPSSEAGEQPAAATTATEQAEDLVGLCITRVLTLHQLSLQMLSEPSAETKKQSAIELCSEAAAVMHQYQTQMLAKDINNEDKQRLFELAKSLQEILSSLREVLFFDESLSKFLSDYQQSGDLLMMMASASDKAKEAYQKALLISDKIIESYQQGQQQGLTVGQWQYQNQLSREDWRFINKYAALPDLIDDYCQQYGAEKIGVEFQLFLSEFCLSLKKDVAASTFSILDRTANLHKPSLTDEQLTEKMFDGLSLNINATLLQQAERRMAYDSAIRANAIRHQEQYQQQDNLTEEEINNRRQQRQAMMRQDIERSMSNGELYVKKAKPQAINAQLPEVIAINTEFFFDGEQHQFDDALLAALLRPLQTTATKIVLFSHDYNQREKLTKAVEALAKKGVVVDEALIATQEQVINDDNYAQWLSDNVLLPEGHHCLVLDGFFSPEFCCEEGMDGFTHRRLIEFSDDEHDALLHDVAHQFGYNKACMDAVNHNATEKKPFGFGLRGFKFSGITLDCNLFNLFQYFSGVKPAVTLTLKEQAAKDKADVTQYFSDRSARSIFPIGGQQQESLSLEKFVEHVTLSRLKRQQVKPSLSAEQVEDSQWALVESALLNHQQITKVDSSRAEDNLETIEGFIGTQQLKIVNDIPPKSSNFLQQRQRVENTLSLMKLYLSSPLIKSKDTALLQYNKLLWLYRIYFDTGHNFPLTKDAFDKHFMDVYQSILTENDWVGFEQDHEDDEERERCRDKLLERLNKEKRLLLDPIAQELCQKMVIRAKEKGTKLFSKLLSPAIEGNSNPSLTELHNKFYQAAQQDLETIRLSQVMIEYYKTHISANHLGNFDKQLEMCASLIEQALNQRKPLFEVVMENWQDELDQSWKVSFKLKQIKVLNRFMDIKISQIENQFLQAHKYGKAGPSEEEIAEIKSYVAFYRKHLGISLYELRLLRIQALQRFEQNSLAVVHSDSTGLLLRPESEERLLRYFMSGRAESKECTDIHPVFALLHKEQGQSDIYLKNLIGSYEKQFLVPYLQILLGDAHNIMPQEMPLNAQANNFEQGLKLIHDAIKAHLAVSDGDSDLLALELFAKDVVKFTRLISGIYYVDEASYPAEFKQLLNNTLALTAERSLEHFLQSFINEVETKTQDGQWHFSWAERTLWGTQITITLDNQQTYPIPSEVHEQYLLAKQALNYLSNGMPDEMLDLNEQPLSALDYARQVRQQLIRSQQQLQQALGQERSSTYGQFFRDAGMSEEQQAEVESMTFLI